MTVDQLTFDILGRIYKAHYTDRPQQFYRDRLALIRAIMRFGSECNKRGWELSADTIYCELLTLLTRIPGQDYEYLPSYLSAAITQYIGMNAEELSSKGKRTSAKVNRVVNNLNVVQVIREPSAAEQMAATLAGLNKAQREKVAERRAVKQAKNSQQELQLL